MTVLVNSLTPGNLYWFKDLNSRSPFSNIISRSVPPSHVVSDIKLFQHTDINDMQEHWMPAVAPYRRSSWWCVAQTIFVALPELNSALLILNLGYLKLFTLINCCFQMPKIKNTELVFSTHPGHSLYKTLNRSFTS